MIRDNGKWVPKEIMTPFFLIDCVIANISLWYVEATFISGDNFLLNMLLACLLAKDHNNVNPLQLKELGKKWSNGHNMLKVMKAVLTLNV